MPIVLEFYVNAAEHKNEQAFVRGHQVSLDAHTINQFYNTLDIENDEYNLFVKGEVDLDKVWIN